MRKFSKKLGIYKVLEKHLFEGLINGGDLYGVLPLTLYANENDISKVTTKENFDLSSVQSKESIAIIITTYQLHNGVGFVDIKMRY
ncbi:hypothetical protein [uncultured Helicobacter sp.]|uniref:hypothetical protein n=1 Tax=uncultured Helicobacter sp. TaxID=175537 RepID=UPI0026388F93|nr:hypothetical protein [uncultured Helicobacter sp.]